MATQGFMIYIAIAALVLILGLLVSAAFLLWGASLAKIENATFGRAIGTTILGGIASSIFSLVLNMRIPIYGGILGFIVGFLISALVAMGIFDTSYGKALGATIISWVLSLIVVGGAVIILVVLMGVSLQSFQP